MCESVFDRFFVKLHRADQAGRKSDAGKAERIQSVFKIKDGVLVTIKADRKRNSIITLCTYPS